MIDSPAEQLIIQFGRPAVEPVIEVIAVGVHYSRSIRQRHEFVVGDHLGRHGIKMAHRDLVVRHTDRGQSAASRRIGHLSRSLRDRTSCPRRQVRPSASVPAVAVRRVWLKSPLRWASGRHLGDGGAAAPLPESLKGAEEERPVGDRPAEVCAKLVLVILRRASLAAGDIRIAADRTGKTASYGRRSCAPARCRSAGTPTGCRGTPWCPTWSRC